jgi:high-affinity Fe2+/Pb2+ permease
MVTIVMLTKELPLVMASATLMAALLTASLIRTFFRFKRKPFKVMAIGVMVVISAGMFMMQSMT